jgi:hypothetical protein
MAETVGVVPFDVRDQILDRQHDLIDLLIVLKIFQ